MPSPSAANAAFSLGSKHHRHVFGAYNWYQGTIFWTSAETKNSATFIACLEELLVKDYPTGRVGLVMDNASYHKNASVLAALSLFEHRVMVSWLPSDYSDLNPIEIFWRLLKDLACVNRLEDNRDSPKETRTAERSLPCGFGPRVPRREELASGIKTRLDRRVDCAPKRTCSEPHPSLISGDNMDH